MTQAETKSIEFKPAQAAIQETSPNLLSGAWKRWQRYWDDSFYSPLALSRWAYDDSTMGKWYGIGFIWFLVRLIIALFLSIFDIILILVCIVAAIFYVFFGTTGRNIAYGICSLLAGLICYALMPVRRL
ncbi:hypothetical protein [Actinomadura fibrosa]|uniref:DUF2628 domain-containing protein n=1 Tax=Actinomadura fibrosa TaxID=111802 RepID=A0ABW2XTW8_9ACTN|nr:hypothetical protein [Actinomadura fibrosa]